MNEALIKMLTKLISIKNPKILNCFFQVKKKCRLKQGVVQPLQIHKRTQNELICMTYK